MTPERLLRIHLDACRLHTEILAEALAESRPWLPFTAESVQKIEKTQLRVLDQAAYRFAKLQDTLGQKVLPAILEITQEPIPPEATFAEKLNRLERLEAIPSAEEWKKLREARNAIAHEYPDAPELRASAINSFLDGAKRLNALCEFVEAYTRKHIPQSL